MTQIQKYIWVIETLRQSGPLSLKELNEAWSQIETYKGNAIIRQTFDRWKAGILDMFGIVIGCQLTNGYKYYLENPEVLDDDSIRNWILNSFSALHSVAENVQLEKRILVEDIPSSSFYLQDILKAMKQNQVIQLTYRNFYKSHACTFLVEPYCVKLFQKRWYLLGHSIYDDTMRLYGLDRIQSIHVTEDTFTMPADFDAKTWFRPYFGIVVDPQEKVTQIVLRVKTVHRAYLKSLPLHPTQREIATTDEYSDFELTLCPTYDFCMELLKLGTKVEVIAPQSLRRRMQQQVKEMSELYQDECPHA